MISYINAIQVFSETMPVDSYVIWAWWLIPDVLATGENG